MTAYLNKAAINCALGSNLTQFAENLFKAEQLSSFFTNTDQYSPDRVLPLGLVQSPLADVTVEGENSRNNRLLASTISPLLSDIDALKARYGSHRIGIVLGTSTSGISDGEAAVSILENGDQDASIAIDPNYDYQTQEFSAPVRFLSKWLGISGPAWVVSTACTSGSKALASAARLLELGVCDAVIAGGVDSLCKMTVAGFSSLMVTSEQRCNPFSVNRNGINIGEASAVFLVSKTPSDIRIAGIGETSDAYHISSPEPEGKGAKAAMLAAIKQAGIKPDDVDYLNLHGTATEHNDLMEARAVDQVFAAHNHTIACGSTKALTGHTLAAAGAVEALICSLSLQRSDGLLPPQIWDEQLDPALPRLAGLGKRQLDNPAKYALSNSFAFGGNNVSLLLARE